MTSPVSDLPAGRADEPTRTGPQDRARLVLLRDASSVARGQMMAARGHPRDTAGLAIARMAYLRSLGEYGDALERLALPLPPRLRDELRLLRRVFRTP